MAQYTLTARKREKKGKQAAKRIRKDNGIPAIFYGPNTDPIMLTVDSSDLEKIMQKTIGENIILGLHIESDNGTDIRKVILKELVTDPVNDMYLHADFHEISMDKELTVEVPVQLINTPVGVTNGGILQHVRRNITISCLPDKLMDSINVDVSDLDMGDSLHIGDIKLPEGVTLEDDGKLTLAVVIAPSVLAAEEIEGEEEEEKEEGEDETAVEETDTKSDD
jgi:large subunit ribosomal protein L25